MFINNSVLSHLFHSINLSEIILAQQLDPSRQKIPNFETAMVTMMQKMIISFFQ